MEYDIMLCRCSAVYMTCYSNIRKKVKILNHCARSSFTARTLMTITIMLEEHHLLFFIRGVI